MHKHVWNKDLSPWFGSAPLQICQHEKVVVTAVVGLLGQHMAIAGFADGRILFSEAAEDVEPKIIKRLPGPAVQALAVATGAGWLFAADEDGRTHWMSLG